MNKKTLTPEEAEEVLPILSEIGKEEHSDISKRYRGAIPDNLTDVLAKELRAGVRTRIAKRLIDIALSGNSKDALAAIKEIWDRMEGRSRQTTVLRRDQEDPLLRVLSEVYKSEDKLADADYKVHVLPVRLDAD